MKLRRCGKDGGPDRDRWDFTDADSSIFPMYVFKGGSLYGFCPGKATWDHEAASVFKILIITAETGALYSKGGIEDQPSWFIEQLSWFLPTYDNTKFYTKANAVGRMIGGSKDNASGKRPVHRSGNRR